MRNLFAGAVSRPALMAAALCTAAPVLAAEAPASGTEADADADAGVGVGVGDIVVTAQRRAENLQDVTVAITALGADSIEKFGITDVLDIAQITPGVTMTEFNVGEPQTYIRGVGSQTDSAASESSVTIAMDEVSIGRGGASPIAILDAQRVEVLRGPQGTLYGRNASAGVIAFYSNRPRDRFEASLEASYGSFDTYGAKGVINAPVADGIAVRAAGQYSNSDGFARNIATGEKLQGGERYGGRIQMQAELGRLTVLLGADYAKDDLSGDSRFGVASRAAVPAILAAMNAAQADRDNVWQSEGIPGTYQRRRNYGFLGRLDYDAGFATLSSLTAYRNNLVNLRADYGGIEAPFPFLTENRVRDASHQFSQELRLSSPDTSEIKWVGGLFYYEDRVDRNERFIVATRAPLPAALGGDNSGIQSARSKSYALFGQLTLPFASIWELTIGGRLTHDRKRVFQQAVHNAPAGQGLGFPFFPGSPYAVTPEASFTKPTWRAILSVEPAAGKRFYLSYDRGYKSGTFTSQAQNATQATFLVKPERLDSFNLGAKTSWLDNSFRFNVDAFYIDYRDLQVFEFGQTLNFVLANADAKIKGIEFDATAAPAPWFRAGSTFAYLDAAFTSNPTFAGATLPYDGNALPRAPKFKIAPYVEINAPVAAGELTMRADYALQDDFFYNPGNDPASRQKSYGVLGAYLGWETADGFKVSLTGDNLLSKKYSLHSISFQGLGFRIFAPPRSVTLAVSKSF